MFFKNRIGRRKIIILYTFVLILSLILFLIVYITNKSNVKKNKFSFSKEQTLRNIQATDNFVLESFNAIISTLPSHEPEFPDLLSSKCKSITVSLIDHQESYSLNFRDNSTSTPNIFGNYARNIRDYLRALRYCLTYSLDRVFISKDNNIQIIQNTIDQLLSQKTLGNFLRNISYLQSVADQSIKEDNSFPDIFITNWSNELNVHNNIIKQILETFQESVEQLLSVDKNLKNANNENVKKDELKELVMEISLLLVKFKSTATALPILCF